MHITWLGGGTDPENRDGCGKRQFRKAVIELFGYFFLSAKFGSLGFLRRRSDLRLVLATDLQYVANAKQSHLRRRVLDTM